MCRTNEVLHFGSHVQPHVLMALPRKWNRVLATFAKQTSTAEGAKDNWRIVDDPLKISNHYLKPACQGVLVPPRRPSVKAGNTPGDPGTNLLTNQFPLMPGDCDHCMMRHPKIIPKIGNGNPQFPNKKLLNN